ncbi:MAG: hypothetical protein HYX99_04500 [Chloroflexi bacterium]|nr:hypothetical protein [Chloroflexota bacterium]
MPAEPVTAIAQPYRYSLPAWEARHLWGKWLFLLGQPLRGGAPGDTEAKAQLREFFTITEQIAAAQAELERAASLDDGPARQAASTRLKELGERRSQLQPQVEAILEAEIARALGREGLSSGLGPWQLIFPPVDFTFGATPHLLITSPRDRIELRQTILLAPDITLERVEDIEDRVEALGISAIIERVGGLATYPSVVSGTAPLEWTVTTAIHEWVHHYLFFDPLGRSYRSSPEMTTVNETLADLVAQELAPQVLSHLFPELARPDPPVPGPSQPAPPAPDAFNFNREIRVTRLQVDELLAQGQTEAAERYMGERRVFLAQNGYYIRKLNQAYFAWHGTYADSPASASPVADLLRGLRADSPSLEAFVRLVARVASYEEFLALSAPAP